ncbi:GNAT family N-acetyltransferase [Bacillus sp. FJAT-45350]|uniref:GNAT family N-acetyltransferase n=1 Tax=Bacillus sp. FJAT-45350 TaxID=2011014 RepID=UPI000BB9319E|nr:GNAT family N-acetyltransferase [Bacillus sp. FJAT-45350]
MINAFHKTLEEIASTLNNYDLEAVICYEEPGRVCIRINEYMKDPGFGYDNTLLHVFMDERDRCMFIGLLRIPRHLRKTGLGSIVISNIMEFVNKHHFFIYLDACNDSQRFWAKHGFKHMFYDPNQFDIMGYSADQWDIFWEWEDFRKTKVFQTFLVDHDFESA